MFLIKINEINKEKEQLQNPSPLTALTARPPQAHNQPHQGARSSHFASG